MILYLYHKIDIIKHHHYKCEYELELEINNDGAIQHNNCINHCLALLLEYVHNHTQQYV